MKLQKKSIFFTDKGKGKVIVLLHGFTESGKIWTSFAARLSKNYRVITIDLPGHGKSDTISTVHSMELMAGVVFEVLKKVNAGKCLMIGHSMGGYVTLAFADKYPKLLHGIVIFHSHCFADTVTDQVNRDRTIAIVRQDKIGFISQFIPGLFPVEVHKKFSKQIEKLIRQASKMDKEGVIASLEGMKIRKDQSEVLRTIKIPVLFILGQKDSKAPVGKIWEMISMPVTSEILLMRDCGHMGYIEAPEKTLHAISSFVKKIL